MTAYQLIGPLPLVTLEPGMTVTVEAIDPATGAAVTGVIISNAAIYITTDTPDDANPEASGPLPVFVPVGDG